MPPNFLPDVIDVASDRKKVSTLLEYVALASKTAEEQQVYFTGPLGLLENQGVQQAESNLEVKDIFYHSKGNHRARARLCLYRKLLTYVINRVQ